jgi:hypothetical protein
MTGIWIAVAAGAILIAAALASALGRRRTNRHRPRTAEAVIAGARSSTSLDDSTGAVRSVQTAEVLMDTDALEQIWSAEYLERLARTYWRFLSRVTLGLIRVRYGENERAIVLLFAPLRLLTFQAPEYEMDPQRGLVRWRIARGLLVARRGRDGGGYLQIEVRRDPHPDADTARLRVSVEVANFYPSIASGLSRPIYNATQSRIHVIITHRFLRSLQRLDLAESRVGLFRPERGDSAR